MKNNSEDENGERIICPSSYSKPLTQAKKKDLKPDLQLLKTFPLLFHRNKDDILNSALSPPVSPPK